MTDTIPAARFYSGKQCQRLLSCTRWQFLKLRSDPLAQFPLPIPRSSTQHPRYSRQAVDNWIATRDAAAEIDAAQYRRALATIGRISESTTHEYVSALAQNC